MRTRRRIACLMSMQEVSGAKTETGHQNKDFGLSHVASDWKDTNLVQEYIEERNPFDCGQELCNVSDISGVRDFGKNDFFFLIASET